jgi:hypothetical protein
MPDNKQLIESLKSLKAKLNGQNMSVLVGSGFSKNASPLFPSWFELLFDMAYLHKRQL